jgi:sarcosine oxidase subunit gamma
MLYRVLQGTGAQFAVSGDGLIAAGYPDAVDEASCARRMGLADLSVLPRTGFKGKDTPNWLQAREVLLPEAPNKARPQDDGALVARLSWDEHMILGDLHERSALAHRLEGQWQIDPELRCYHMPRAHSHCRLLLSGEATPEMLAKVCGVDLRPSRFADDDVAQTSVARINAIVIRHDLGETLAYHVLADSASAEYLCSCLLDAMGEFDGRPVGLNALRDLAGA